MSPFKLIYCLSFKVLFSYPSTANCCVVITNNIEEENYEKFKKLVL